MERMWGDHLLQVEYNNSTLTDVRGHLGKVRTSGPESENRKDKPRPSGATDLLRTVYSHPLFYCNLSKTKQFFGHAILSV